jgi:DivIVA domain-containing protein
VVVVQNGRVSTTFPRTPRSRRGYNVDQVEEFLEEARRAYSAEAGAPVAVNALSIRHTAFAMQRAGYSPSHVDAALERLEDAFAARERQRLIDEGGAAAWQAEAESLTQDILARLARPDGRRFARTGILTNGYDRTEVDKFAGRLVRYFGDSKPLTIADVRTAAFHPRKGGYREAQVDLFLDSVVSVMQAVR